jgi:hypothetical protein
MARSRPLSNNGGTAMSKDAVDALSFMTPRSPRIWLGGPLGLGGSARAWLVKAWDCPRIQDNTIIRLEKFSTSTIEIFHFYQHFVSSSNDAVDGHATPFNDTKSFR